MQSDIESGIWDPLNPQKIVYSSEDGTITGIELRKLSQQGSGSQKQSQYDYLFHTQAHEKAVTSVNMSSQIKDYLASTSLDGTIKIWDTNNIQNQSPNLVFQKDAKAGKLYCGSFYQESPWLFACGSSVGELVIWDTTECAQIVETFRNRAPEQHQPKNIQLTTTKEVKQIQKEITQKRNKQKKQKQQQQQQQQIQSNENDWEDEDDDDDDYEDMEFEN